MPIDDEASCNKIINAHNYFLLIQLKGCRHINYSHWIALILIYHRWQSLLMVSFRGSFIFNHLLSYFSLRILFYFVMRLSSKKKDTTQYTFCFWKNIYFGLRILKYSIIIYSLFKIYPLSLCILWGWEKYYWLYLKNKTIKQIVLFLKPLLKKKNKKIWEIHIFYITFRKRIHRRREMV